MTNRGTWLVLAQFSLLAALLWACPIAAPIQAGLWPVVLLQIVAIAWGAWAALTMLRAQRHMFNIRPDPNGHNHLVQDGPYRWVKHPMYSALLMFFGALVISCLNVFSAILWLALLAVLLVKARYEEGLLRERFASYDDYAKNTPCFVPNLF